MGRDPEGDGVVAEFTGTLRALGSDPDTLTGATRTIDPCHTAILDLPRLTEQGPESWGIPPRAAHSCALRAGSRQHLFGRARLELVGASDTARSGVRETRVRRRRHARAKNGTKPVRQSDSTGRRTWESLLPTGMVSAL
jgi:hypothetical protein